MTFSPDTFLGYPPGRQVKPSEQRMALFADVLLREGIDAALQALNGGVPHRYTGIFKVDGELLQNTHMFDKLGELKPKALETVVLSDSFCQIVLRDGYFLTDHSGRDDRLNFSPYKNVVLSYHGVPILNNQAELHGTLCHFDLVEQSLSDEEFWCLQEAAKLLPRRLFK